MGASAAFIFPATLSTLTVVFEDRRERAKAFGFWGATTGIAIALGPIAGGSLITHFFFGSIFLVNVPVALVGVVAIASVVPESTNPERHRLDLAGLVARHERRDRADPGDHPGTVVGLALLADAGALRRRRVAAQRIRELSNWVTRVRS